MTWEPKDLLTQSLTVSLNGNKRFIIKILLVLMAVRKHAHLLQ